MDLTHLKMWKLWALKSRFLRALLNNKQMNRLSTDRKMKTIYPSTYIMYSADNIWKYFFLFFPDNRFWHFMQTVSYNLHEMSKPILCKKNKKKILSVCWIIPHERSQQMIHMKCKALFFFKKLKKKKLELYLLQFWMLYRFMEFQSFQGKNKKIIWKILSALIWKFHHQVSKMNIPSLNLIFFIFLLKT